MSEPVTIPFRQPDDPKDLRVAEVVALYLSDLAERCALGEYSEHALDDRRRQLNGFAAAFGSRRISECEQGNVLDWLKANPQWGNWARRGAVAGLLACFNWAAFEAERIRRNPYRKPKRLRLAAEPRREATTAEYVAMMRYAPRTIRRMLFFLRRTGARTCEARELRWADIEWELGAILLEKHKTRGQQSDPQARIIGLDLPTLRFLRNLKRQAAPGQELVFVNTRGGQWDRHTFARQFRRYADKLGLAGDVSAYCLRHTYGTTAIESGIGERQLADQMGHTTTRMIGHYSHAAEKAAHLRNIAEQIARARRKKK